MKFGKTLKRTLYPSWSEYYVDYKNLKQYINTLAEKKQHPQLLSLQPNTTAPHNSASNTIESQDTKIYTGRRQFLQSIYNEAHKVNTLYILKISEWSHEFTQLCNTIQYNLENHIDVSNEVINRFTTICSYLDKLRSFTMLNHLAFIKILKKYDKHSGDMESIKSQIMDTLMLQPFYSSHDLANLLTLATVTAHHLYVSSNSSITQNENDNSNDIQEFICSICLDIVNNPVVLPCSHWYCFQCLTHLHATQHISLCAVCRRPQSLDPSTYQINPILDQFVKQKFPKQYHPASLEQQNIWNHYNQQPQQYDNDSTSKILADEAEASALKQSHEHHPNHGISMDVDEDDEVASIQKLHNKAIEDISVTDVSDVSSSEKKRYELPVPDENHIRITQHIDTLLHYITPSSPLSYPATHIYMIFDIDETLHLNPYQPCMMMSEKGLNAYQLILSQSKLYETVPISAKNKTTKVLQHALQAKAFVENHLSATTTTPTQQHQQPHQGTSDTLKQLQAAGVYMFALTARYSHQADTTRKELLQLGIDFNNTSPFPANIELYDDESGASYSNGVIYTNATEKGIILNRMLTGLFKPADADEMLQCHFTEPCEIPKEIIFIDDRYSNCLSVMNDLHIAYQLNIHVDCIHYTHTHVNEQDDNDMQNGHVDIEVIQCQIHHFLHTNEILNDKAAKELLARCKAERSLRASPQPNNGKSSPMPLYNERRQQSARHQRLVSAAN